MRFIAIASIILVASIFGISFSKSQSTDNAHADWPSYGGDAGGSRYSPLADIDKTNVTRLTVAWELHTGDVSDGSNGIAKSEFEATPIVVGETMFVTTPFNRVLALDPSTGKEKWRFDPKIDLRVRYSEGLVNRGVTWWSGSRVPTEPCAQRIFLAHHRCAAFRAGCADRQSLRRLWHRRTDRSQVGHRQHHAPRRIRGDFRPRRDRRSRHRRLVDRRQ